MPPHRPHVFSPLEVNRVKVKTRITDQVAVTSVDQEFYNPNSARLEGTFMFPLPKGAQIDKFTMEIDGKQVEAELLSANKARGTTSHNSVSHAQRPNNSSAPPWSSEVWAIRKSSVPSS